MSNVLIVKKTPRGFQKKPLFVNVGKLVSKKAAERNKIKRRIRAIAVPALKATPFDVMITAKKGAGEAPYKELKQEIVEKLSS